jgi:hypothetical protein
MAAAAADGVVWIGDLGPRVTERALRDAFSQARRGACGAPAQPWHALRFALRS